VTAAVRDPELGDGDVPLACKLPAQCRLPLLTWEFDIPCHSLNRRVSDVLVVNGGGQALKVRWTATLIRKVLSQLAI
jgi:hypothetical protein